MDIMGQTTRYRNAMPTIDRLDTDILSRDGISRQQRAPGLSLSISTGSVLSPTSAAYHAPPPSYSGPPSATPSVVGKFEYISPSSARQVGVEDRAAGLRQSLPSLHEALGADRPVPFPASNGWHPSPVTSREIPQKPTFAQGQSVHEAPPGPPNPFSHVHGSTTTVLDKEPHPSPSINQQEYLLEQEKRNAPFPLDSIPCKAPFPLVHASESPPVSPLPVDYRYSKPGAAHPASSDPFHQSQNPNNHVPSSNTSPNQFQSLRSPYSHSTNPSNPPSSTFAPTADYGRGNPSFKFDERKQSSPRSHAVQVYSESVKRQLDIFDIELALREMSEGSSRTIEFVRLWNSRANQSHRSGSSSRSLPSSVEIEKALRENNRVGDALSSIMGAVIAQQTAFEEEQRAAKRDRLEYNHFSGDFPESNSFTIADLKKRRAKAAPPGRCHSCNRAETPEWRRGPDGARTLCNACGLHYAKLTRKMGVSKSTAHSSANLRPKTSEAPLNR